MSNPVTNIEVEDVLNSIRRLVSEDTGEANQGRDEDEERFVLTPALRVESDPDQFDTEEPVLSLGQEHLVGSETPVQQGKTWADDSQEQSGEAPWVRRDEDAPAFEEDSDDLATGGSDADVEKPESGAAFFSHRTVPIEDRVAELEAAIGHSQDEWEPDGSEPEANEAPMRHIFESSRIVRSAEAEAVEELVAQTVEETDAALTPGETEETEAASTDVATVAEDDEPDAPTPTHLHVASSDGEVMEPAAQVPDLPENELGDDALIDEDSLREMVAEIVRQELQGMLGERITRNVRRMVRREIQRALVLKDFE